jgi:hypothetical protein
VLKLPDWYRNRSSRWTQQLIAKKNILFALCLIGLTACATPARNTASELIVGMSVDQVFTIAGDPAKRSSRDSYEAWRYEDSVRIKPCRLRKVGCRRACKHTMVWFNRDVLVSMSSIHVSRLAECGNDSEPVNWNLFPDYAFLCVSDRPNLPATSKLCAG